MAGFRRDQLRRGLLASTINRRMINLCALMRSEDVRTITRQQLEVFLDRRTIGPRTRSLWISHLHVFFLWMTREELRTDDPTDDMVRPRLRRNLPRPATDADLRYALTQASPMVRCWLLLGAYQGLRCQEIAGLRREDVSDTTLRIVQGKGGHERIVPLHPVVAQALRELPMPRTGPVFRRSAGGPFDGPQLSRAFNDFLRYMGIQMTPHQLRHWFATRLYASTHDLRLVQEMLGHQSPQTTAVYTAFSQPGAAEAIEKLALA